MMRILRACYRRIMVLNALMAAMVLAVVLDSRPAQAEFADVILNRKASYEGMRPVIFPHWFHRIRFRCKVCHTELGFEMKVGANEISMTDLINGFFCGACHNDDVAWGLQNCPLCHSGRPHTPTGIIGGAVPGGPR